MACYEDRRRSRKKRLLLLIFLLPDFTGPDLRIEWPQITVATFEIEKEFILNRTQCILCAFDAIVIC